VSANEEIKDENYKTSHPPEPTNVGGQCSSRACSTRQPRFTSNQHTHRL